MLVTHALKDDKLRDEHVDYDSNYGSDYDSLNIGEAPPPSAFPTISVQVSEGL
jgi:hypothetical protein